MAYDGDYAHPQRLRYGLDPTGLPYSNYFDIDPDDGTVKVRKTLQVKKNTWSFLPQILTKNGSSCHFVYKLPLFATFWDRLPYLICVEIDLDDRAIKVRKSILPFW